MLVVTKAVGRRGTWLVFASVVNLCMVMSEGCAVDDARSPSQIEQGSLEGEASGDVGGAKQTADDPQVTQCICPVALTELAEGQQLTTECLLSCGFCGDGLCNEGETRFSCQSDCGPICGNGLCETGESSSSCPGDCGPPPTPCGDGICRNASSVTSAQAQARYAWGQYCRAHPGPSAGGTPRPGTNYLTDQAVTDYSNASTTVKPFLFPIYFDFVSFTTWNVPDGATTDCLLLPTSAINATLCVAGCYPTPVCGNGQCETGESSLSCSADCGPAPAVCGNGICESGESSLSCSVDCGIATCFLPPC